MEEEKKMIDKLKKLLAHEQSARSIGNMAEAEAFAAKIQELLFAHKLTMSDIEIADEEANEPVDQECVEAEHWSGVLAMGCASAAFCKILKSGKALVFIGRASNRAGCIAMFQYLANMGASIARKEMNAYKLTADYEYKVRMRPRFAATWKRSWLAGYANAIYTRLERERLVLTAQAQSAGTSLVYVDREKQALDAYLSAKYPRLRTTRSTCSVYGSAYQQGHSCGSSVSLKGRAALTA
jgi:hypothetical protein